MSEEKGGAVIFLNAHRKKPEERVMSEEEIRQFLEEQLEEPVGSIQPYLQCKADGDIETMRQNFIKILQGRGILSSEEMDPFVAIYAISQAIEKNIEERMLSWDDFCDVLRVILTQFLENEQRTPDDQYALGNIFSVCNNLPYNQGIRLVLSSIYGKMRELDGAIKFLYDDACKKHRVSF